MSLNHQHFHHMRANNARGHTSSTICTWTSFNFLAKKIWWKSLTWLGQALEARCGGSYFVDGHLGHTAKWGRGADGEQLCWFRGRWEGWTWEPLVPYSNHRWDLSWVFFLSSGNLWECDQHSSSRLSGLRWIWARMWRVGSLPESRNAPIGLKN